MLKVMLIIRETAEMDLVTTGVYGLVRHPMYSFLILVFWITPTMVGEK